MFLTRKENEHYKVAVVKKLQIAFLYNPPGFKERWWNEYKKQKERLVELQGEFKKLRPSMFDGEFEEAIESWLLNLLCSGRRLRVSVTYVVKSWVGKSKKKYWKNVYVRTILWWESPIIQWFETRIVNHGRICNPSL